MLRRIIRLVVILPAVAVLAAIGLANTQDVRLALDPFRPDDPALSLVLPFYVWLLAALILGVVVGGLATWAPQARWRRSARARRDGDAALEGRGRPPRPRAAADIRGPLGGSGRSAGSGGRSRQISFADPTQGGQKVSYARNLTDADRGKYAHYEPWNTCSVLARRTYDWPFISE